MSKWKLYNNGIEVKRFSEGEAIPEGWEPGYPKSYRDSIAEKRKQTCLERFGVECASQSDEAKVKSKQTNLQRYGVENPFQSEEIKSKIKETNLKRYGVEQASQSKEAIEKRKKTNLEKYGVEYSFQADEVKEKIRETSLERYGVEHALQSEEIMSRMKVRNLEKFGVENISQSPEIEEKKRKTSLERYGTEHPMQSEEIKGRVRETNQERYGVDCTFQLDSVKEKKKQSYLEHYGVDHPSKAQEIKDKKIQTSREHYGTDYPWQSEEVRESRIESNRKKYGYDYPNQSSEVLEKTSKTCQERYGVPWACMRPEAKRGYSNDSGPNNEFAKLLDDRGIEYEREFALSRYSFDFKIGEILVEIDPTATHNTLWNPFNQNGGIDKDYHKNKSELARSNGYRVIHIFDWDSVEKVADSLIEREMIFARDCEVDAVNSDIGKRFLNKHHLQGLCNGQEVMLGLFYNKDLVSIMTFGKPRYNKKYEWELLRYCTSMNVFNGAVRLFSHFGRDYNPESVISYCDKSKFRGDVYSKLGFNLISSGNPSKHWYNPNTKKHFTDNLVRQRGFDQLMKADFGKGTSNEELLVQHGFTSVYDCGQDTYVWKR